LHFAKRSAQNELLNTKNTNKIMKKTILLFSALLLFSCGFRKVQKSKTEDKTKIAILDTSKTITTDNTIINVVEIDSTSEMIIEPIDTTKEMVVNGKKYTNSRIKWKKTAKVKKLVENKNVVKTERKAVKIDIKQEKKAEIKIIDKQASYYWLLWFLLLIPIWYFLRRYRII
jgi:hypothetical protein